MSMTSPAYGQEVTEASHTALMRNRLLQQMQAPSDADLHHLGSRYSPTSSQAAPKQRCDSREGCLQPPLRGSGHHHYLPSAGEHDDYSNPLLCRLDSNRRVRPHFSVR